MSLSEIIEEEKHAEKIIFLSDKIIFFSSISKVMTNLKHIVQTAQILAIYIENSINMCFEISVFTDRRRDNFVNSSINLVINFLLVIITEADDDML